MAEFKGIVFIRGKKPMDGSKEFARVNNLILLSTKMDMFDACTKLDSAMKHVMNAIDTNPVKRNRNQILLSREFFIHGSDFANAGMVSTNMKSLLKKIGFSPELVRRIAISTFESEMNVVMHAIRASVQLFVTPQLVEVVIDDEGKGIPNVEIAMQEGFTTATEDMRAKGFGSGMGLPNIKKNTDELDISSEVGKGTKLIMRFFI
jgi:anti-sigma regulatory factor (Ser/Thr protein kinase)